MTGSVRQEIVEQLREGQMTAKDLSRALGVREREVYDHLTHVRRSLAGAGAERLVVEPAYCLACGWAFRKRDRLTVPSRCPVCRSSHVAEPRFRVEGHK